MDTVSKTSIASSAAMKLGQEPIRNIDDTDDDVAILINTRFDYCLNTVMQQHDWSCLKKRAILSPQTVAPEFEYSQIFSLPSDCVKVLRVASAGCNIHYEIYGKEIQANEGTIQLEYLAYPSDFSRIDYTFAEAIALYIAWDLCDKITSDQDRRGRLIQEFDLLLGKARKTDREQNRKRKFHPTGWLKSRFRAVNDYIPSDQIDHS